MQPVVDGATQLLFIVGDPIAQVRSPLVYNPKILASGKNSILLPLRIPETDFEHTIPSIMQIGNLAGLIITFPFKERILPYLTKISDDAALIGAVNAVKKDRDGKWVGDIFDGVGMVRAVEALGQSLLNRNVLLYGAGGAGKAIAAAVLKNGARSLTIIDRDGVKAQSLVSILTNKYPQAVLGCTDTKIEHYDLLVNATPVGMAAGDTHVAWQGSLHSGITVVDIVPYPIETPLLAHAKACGCPHTNGQAMIQGQSEAVLEYLEIL